MGSDRCTWAGDDPLMVAYHDEEWGVPLRDDRALFELLCLEGAQAGLSWRTILKKRTGYRSAFEGFDPKRLARWTEADVDRLAGDGRIVRNRAKIRSVIQNARAFLALSAERPFADFLWAHVGGRPIVRGAARAEEIPAATPESEALSRALKGAGFSFVGPTICYAFMQSAGLVMDHTTDCFRFAQLKDAAGSR